MLSGGNVFEKGCLKKQTSLKIVNIFFSSTGSRVS
jgi:hypothetical protein